MLPVKTNAERPRASRILLTVNITEQTLCERASTKLTRVIAFNPPMSSTYPPQIISKNRADSKQDQGSAGAWALPIGEALPLRRRSRISACICNCTNRYTTPPPILNSNQICCSGKTAIVSRLFSADQNGKTPTGTE
jgi:hypothetical protein